MNPFRKGSFLSHYKWDVPLIMAVFAAIGFFFGPPAMAPLGVLVVLEISLSFDNAVVNARVLERLSEGWRRAFLTIGIAVAVFGMRFVFPILIVSLTAGLGFGEVIGLALGNPHLYAEKLAHAHPEIAMLGGVYLGMIFMDFFFEEHGPRWLKLIEKQLEKVGQVEKASTIIMAITVLVLSRIIGGDEGARVLFTGIVSLVLYMVVNAIADIFETEDDLEAIEHTKSPVKTGLAGLGLFLYLEMQDAAFSFDGVTGAFAITDQVVIIAAGLGIGALVVRSMTIHLVETGQLAKLPYLEHGAHWAIGGLAVCMMTSLFIEIPEFVTGGIGVMFIAASIWSSIRVNKLAAEGKLPDWPEYRAVEVTPEDATI